MIQNHIGWSRSFVNMDANSYNLSVLKRMTYFFLVCLKNNNIFLFFGAPHEVSHLYWIMPCLLPKGDQGPNRK